LLGPLPAPSRKVVRDILNCRTSALGGHIQKCDSCDFEKNSYNSCRNRHCPKCQFMARSRWVENRVEDLLPCQYFHVVFTLPSELRPLVRGNKRHSYDILFKAASQTLKEVALNPKHLGAEIGCIGVLHTWGQNLMDHPHLHFIVPGGGLSLDKSKWLTCKRDYLLPIRVLSKVFRGKILSSFEQAFHKGKLGFYGELEDLAHPVNFNDLMIRCASKEFVVYAKEPFAGPQQVIDYLGDYTHRIAISNYRLVGLEGENVVFKVRDKQNPAKKKLMRLHVREFMRRFLLHVLPKGFVRIRHYGFLGSRSKNEKISIIRLIQGVVEKVKAAVKETWEQTLLRLTGLDAKLCPECQKGTMLDYHPLKLLLNSS